MKRMPLVLLFLVEAGVMKCPKLGCFYFGTCGSGTNTSHTLY